MARLFCRLLGHRWHNQRTEHLNDHDIHFRWCLRCGTDDIRWTQ